MKFLRAQIILVVILLFYKLNSQNCNCNLAESNRLKFKEYLAKNSKESVDSILKIIKSSETIACEIQYNLFFARKSFSNRNYEELMNSISKAQILLTKSNCPSSNFMDLYTLKGQYFFERDIYDSSAYYYLQAITISETIGDSLNLSKLYGYLGCLYGKMGETRAAISHLQKSIKIGTIIKEIEDRAVNYGMLYNCYLKLSFDSKKKLYIDSMFHALSQSYKLIKRTSNESKLSQIYHKYAGAHIWVENYNKADKYIDSAIILAYKYNNLPSLSSSYSMRFHLNKDIKDYRKALIYVDSVIKYATKLQTNLTLSNCYKNKYEIYKSLNDYELALKSHEIMVRFTDSLQMKERSETVNELEKKYNQIKNEKEINELKQQEEINKLQIRSLIAVSIGAVLLFLIIVFSYRQSIIKNKLKTIEIEQRLNRARMNPHFFFNALGSLQNLSMQKSKQELVPGYISKFSKIMRQSLESTFNEMETLESEILFLTDYLEIQKLRSENRFDYEINIDEAIEQSDILIPGMILQPFIENSIEHGFKDLSYAGLITISFQIQSNLLEIKIQDNGVGVKDFEKHKTYPSRATQIIRDRLFLLNKKYKTNANFVISKSDNNTGIEVKITLPTIYK